MIPLPADHLQVRSKAAAREAELSRELQAAAGLLATTRGELAAERAAHDTLRRSGAPW